MNRQYIGARYVPKFFEENNGAWMANREYEPLTIVQYMSNSYTSKKPVPASVGNPSENADYWVCTGNYNAQVEEYHQEVELHKEKVEEYHQGAEQEITKIKKVLERTYLFVGDSYGDNPRVNTTWATECANAMNLDSKHYSNLCRSGASWCAVNAVNHDYLHEIMDYSGDRSEVTDIVIAAGANDCTSSYTNILAAMRTFSSYVKKNYPNAIIWCGWVGFGTSIMGTAGLYTAFQAYESCGYAGMRYMKNLLASNHEYDRLEDGVLHPDADACRTIGWAVATCLNGGSYNATIYSAEYYMNNKSSSLVPVNSGRLNIGNVYYGHEGDYFHINFSKNVILFNDTRLTFTNNQRTRIANLSTTYFRPKNEDMTFAGTMAYCVDGTNYHTVAGWFSFENDDGAIYLCFTPIIESTPISNINVVAYTVDIHYPLVAC